MTDERFYRLLYEAARQLGWFGLTEEQVRESEKDFDEDAVELPESLRDPLEVLDRETSFAKRPTRGES